MTEQEHIEGLAEVIEENWSDQPKDIAQAISYWHREQGLRVVPEDYIQKIVEAVREGKELADYFGQKVVMGVDDIRDRLMQAANGHPNAEIPWPHRVLHDAKAEIDRLQSELEKTNEERDKFKWQVRDTCQRAEKSEAELEAERAKGEQIYEKLTAAENLAEEYKTRFELERTKVRELVKAIDGYLGPLAPGDWTTEDQMLKEKRDSIDNTPTALTETEQHKYGVMVERQIRADQIHKDADWLANKKVCFPRVEQSHGGVVKLDYLANELRQRAEE